MQELATNMGVDKRREKHLLIDDALNELEYEIHKTTEFIAHLSDAPTPTAEAAVRGESELPFSPVYNTIAERIKNATIQIADQIQEIRGILL